MTRARNETAEMRRARTAAARAASPRAAEGTVLILASTRLPVDLAARYEAMTAVERGEVMTPHLRTLPEVPTGEYISGYIIRVTTAGGRRAQLGDDGRAIVYPTLTDATEALVTLRAGQPDHRYDPIRVSGRLPAYAR